ncbi:class I SAM-dependent methyltransferase [Sphingosinithalassobacter sp. LHW66-3]|uniref:class I SAM-dependent methyltransferase n=1 Tax=Sphingosinithalassobacter sp. LHW66-3 TaxID=3424718 RepID=UPI003D6B8AB9
MDPTNFTPALGRPKLTGAYDLAIRLLTREMTWRSALLDQLAPSGDDVILDVGCGTGTFALLIKEAVPNARVVGLDPDPAVLEIAAGKASAAGIEIDWRQAFAHEADRYGDPFTKIVSSLVFHQVPMEEKRRGIAAMVGAVRSGGEVHIADYARQRSRLMRALFGLVQRLDGFENTEPNARGAMEAILADLEPDSGRPRRVVRTPTGEISLFRLKVAPALQKRLAPPVTGGSREAS